MQTRYEMMKAGAVVASRPCANDIDVAEIRKSAFHIGQTQKTFAAAIGVPVKTLRNWEQRRRKPTGPALVLLSLIKRDPWIVLGAKSENDPLA